MVLSTSSGAASRRLAAATARSRRRRSSRRRTPPHPVPRASRMRLRERGSASAQSRLPSPTQPPLVPQRRDAPCSELAEKCFKPPARSSIHTARRDRATQFQAARSMPTSDGSSVRRDDWRRQAIALLLTETITFGVGHTFLRSAHSRVRSRLAAGVFRRRTCVQTAAARGTRAAPR